MEPNQAEVIALVWSGPFPLRTIAAPDAPPEAQAAGVYVWTARVGDEWWPYYIGETGKAFATRQREHLRLYHEGEYRVCEPRAFAEGRKVLLWPGAYGPQNRYKLPWFRFILPDIASALEDFISLLHVFLIPVEGGQRPRERLEAALAEIPKSAPGDAARFQDEDIHYRPCGDDEGPLTFTLQPLPIAGLSGLTEIHLPLASGLRPAPRGTPAGN